MSEQYSRAEQYSRTVRLIGQDALDKLRGCRVAVFGLGGVGGYAVEALARSGVGALDLIDSDAVAVSNLNRQLIATRSSVGQLKVDAFARRIQDIDPSITVHRYPVFYLPEKRDAIPFSEFKSFVVEPGGIIFETDRGTFTARFAFTFQNPLVAADILAFAKEGRK